MPHHLSRIKHPSSVRRCDLSHQILIPKEVTECTHVATLAGNGSKCVGLTVSKTCVVSIRRRPKLMSGQLSFVMGVMVRLGIHAEDRISKEKEVGCGSRLTQDFVSEEVE